MGDLDSLKALACIAIECTMAQLLATNVLHGDPHGGNLLLRNDGEGRWAITNPQRRFYSSPDPFFLLPFSLSRVFVAKARASVSGLWGAVPGQQEGGEGPARDVGEGDKGGLRQSRRLAAGHGVRRRRVKECRASGSGASPPKD